ncbi:NAD-dependent epimerase/dehydratase family protein [Streptomyces sp. NPDC003442]
MSRTSTDTVLVTGGSGFLGGRVIAQALREGHQVRTTVRSAPASLTHWSAGAHEILKRQHAEVQARCRFLERLQIYATALNLSSLKHAARSGRDAGAAKIRGLPRQPQHLP